MANKCLQQRVREPRHLQRNAAGQSLVHELAQSSALQAQC